MEKTVNYNQRISSLVSSAALAVVLAGLFLWLRHDPTAEFTAFAQGLDNQPPGLGSGPAGETVVIGETFQLFDSSAVEPSSDWPRFRGSDFSNILTTGPALSDLAGGEPPLIWSRELGEGHAGAAVWNGRIYILDYDEEEQADALRCFALSDGRELWRRSYGVRIKRNHGISRTVPAVNNGYVLTIGPRCHVMCVDAISGDFLWGLDLEKEFGTEVPLWYTGQCPLIDGNTAVIASGGKSLLVGIDCGTGEILWETENPDNWKMSHSSVIPMTLHGEKQYVYSAVEGIVSVSAEEESRGEVLWKSRMWAHSVTAPSPLYLGDNKLFLTAGYGAGGMLVQVNREQGQYSLDSLQVVRPGDGCAAEQQTPILFDRQIWTILPKDGGARKGEFVSYDYEDISKVTWASGKTQRFGLGPFILADNKFYVLDDMGVLSVYGGLGSQPELRGQHKILEGPDAWAPLAIVDGLLLARDPTKLVCLDISDKQLSWSER